MFKSLCLVLALCLAIPAAAPQPAEAATTNTQKKKAKKAPLGKGRDGYTAEQRKKMMERARQICRKEFGASATVYDVDFRNLRVRCLPPGA